MLIGARRQQVMKASEVGGFLRRIAGKRDRREALPDDYVVIRPGPNFHWIMHGDAARQPAPAASEQDRPGDDRGDAEGRAERPSICP